MPFSIANLPQLSNLVASLYAWGLPPPHPPTDLVGGSALSKKGGDAALLVIIIQDLINN